MRRRDVLFKRSRIKGGNQPIVDSIIADHEWILIRPWNRRLLEVPTRSLGDNKYLLKLVANLNDLLFDYWRDQRTKLRTETSRLLCPLRHLGKLTEDILVARHHAFRKFRIDHLFPPTIATPTVSMTDDGQFKIGRLQTEHRETREALPVAPLQRFQAEDCVLAQL